MDDEPRFKSFVGCLAHFGLMAAVTWLVIIGTGMLIYSRWCGHP